MLPKYQITPVKGSLLPPNDVRDITLEESNFYKIMREHYMDMCTTFPCNRNYKECFDTIVKILKTGKIGTYVSWA